jgi:hypothetical protein
MANYDYVKSGYSGGTVVVDLQDAERVASVDFTEGSAPSALVLTAPVNASITRVVMLLNTPAAGGSPVMSVGTATDPTKYMGPWTLNGTAGVYDADCFVAASAGPVSLFLTPGGQTFSGTLFVFYTIAS